ncbi:hypothetical protein ACFX2I_039761 [Malus domestica]
MYHTLITTPPTNNLSSLMSSSSSSSETSVAAAARFFVHRVPILGLFLALWVFVIINSLRQKKAPWLARLARVWHVPLSVSGTTPN